MLRMIFSAILAQVSDRRTSRHLQPDYSMDFVETFEDAGHYAEPLLVGRRASLRINLAALSAS